MKKLLFVFLILIASHVVNAQGPARCLFSGIIVLEDTKKPITGAQLFLSDFAPVRGEMDANWSSAVTDSEGKFSIDVKGTPMFMRIVRAEGDTIDLSLETIPCNSSRDISLAIDEEPQKGITYQSLINGVQLPEVILQAFAARSSIQSLPASVGLIDKQLLESTDRSSLQNALNTIPGVMMESRGYGGSHRFSIRGSSLRSPFAVRNVKMYLDGMPLTSADGQTPLELVDAFDIGEIEIIKGPAGSMYGSGNGGVLLMKTIPIDSGVVRLHTGFQAGSNDGYRQTASASVGFKSGALRISQVLQDYAGYRQQEFNRKNQGSIHYKHHITSSQSLVLFGTYYKGNWGLPGALNEEQADTLPTMAVPFSLTNNASLARERYVGGISHTGKWNRYFSHNLHLVYQKTNKENPYGTSAFNSGYKFENSQSISGRATVDFNKSWKDLNLLATLGGEWQTEDYSILEKTIESALPKEFKYAYDIGYLQTMGFMQGVIKWSDVITLQAGLSTSTNEQFVMGENSAGFDFDTTATWGNSILPRAALSVRIFDGFYAYGSLSAGAANPTVFEMIDQENNAYNLQLTSERGRLNELGVRHQWPKSGIEYSITAYDFHTDRAILPFTITNEAGESLQRYHNDGSTRQQGIEWSFKWAIIRSSQEFTLKVVNNGTLNRHQFDKYTLDDIPLDGNSLPGVPLAQMTMGLQMRYKGLSMAMYDFWMDRMPLNNSGSEQTQSYHLMNTIISYQFFPFQKLECSLQAGINNLLNTEYSSFLNINGAAGKYYNPSPTRNYYLGVHLNYGIPVK